MYFELIKISKCNRFSLGGRDSITIRPTAKIQTILGTNGSGKSSLLSIGFSPLPPSDRDFEHGGSWEVHILDKGHKYQLSAKFADKNSYSFIKDGVELNTGNGTITVQLELVKTHFGYTRELHELLTGKIQFTKMTAQQRRDWIAKLSSADFTYAFSKFMQYKKGYNAAQAVTKFLKGRINEEEQRLITPEDAESMRRSAKEVKASILDLLQVRKPVSVSMSESHLQREFNQLIKDIEKFLTEEYPNLDSKNLDLAREELQKLNNELSAAESVLKIMSDRFTSSEQALYRTRSKLAATDVVVLSEEISALEAQYLDISKKTIDIPDDLLIPCPDVIREMLELLNDLPNGHVDSKTLMERQRDSFIAKETLDKVKWKLENLTDKLSDIENCGDVTCPSCNSVFKPGVDPNELTELRTRVSNGNLVLRKSQDEYQRVNSLYLEANSIRSAYEAIEKVKDKYSRSNNTSGLFTYIEQSGGFSIGKKLFEVIGIYNREVSKAETRRKLKSAIENKKELLRISKECDSSLSNLEQDYNKASADYGEAFARKKDIVDKIELVKKSLNYAEHWDQTHRSLMDRYQNIVVALDELLDNDGYAIQTDALSRLQSKLAVVETALAENDLVESILKDLNNQLKKSQDEEKVYKALVDVICPKSGLIAELISSQIGAIVNAVNKMIERLWGYPLYIEMPESIDNGLDYKFPISNGGKPISDVGDGSDSMKEVVDRAFIWTAYYSLDLVDYPLFLDEPGRTFDPVHRQNLIPLIKDLADSDRFGQLLFISHDLDSQTAFPNSETIILDDRNISYPYPYNEHVTFS